MSWIEPDAWLDAGGARAGGLRARYRPRGEEDALARALADDPRRVIALVGPPGAGTSRLGLELARRWVAAGGRAWYRDPIPAPDPHGEVDALAARLAGLDAAASPLVILDGPDRDEALAPLAELCQRRLHPRLRVLVPCDHDTAPDLPALTGLPRGSILVALVDGGGAGAGADGVATPPPPLPTDVAVTALLPLVLAGRAPAGADPDLALLVERGLAAPDRDRATVVCTIEERTRRALAGREVLDAPDGAARLAAVRERHPGLAPAIARTLVRWTRGDLPAALVPIVSALDGDGLAGVLDLAARGILPAPPLARALADQARALAGDDASAGDTGADDDAVAEAHAALAEVRAELARLRRDRPALEAALAAAVARARTPARRGRLLRAQASLARSRALAQQAVDEAAVAGAARPHAAALATLAELCQAEGEVARARAGYARAAGLLDAVGALAPAATLRAAAAALAAEAGDLDDAAPSIARVVADRRALGDAQGALFALDRLASWELQRDRADDARRAAEDACELATAIGDLRGVGYARWLLGALAERGGDGRLAMAHYAASLDAYADLGDVPDRVVASLASLQRAYAPAEPPPPADAAGLAAPTPASERLVPLRRRPP